MPIAARLVVAGMSAVAASASVGTSVSNLTAVGASQATAAVIPADISKFTAGAGAGCILPAMNGGDNIVVINATGGALLLYPPIGGFINALGQNASYSIANATPYCGISCVDPTHYHCFQSA